MHFTTERLERLQRSLELALNQEWPQLSATQVRLAKLRPQPIPARAASAKQMSVVATVATDGGENKLSLEPIQLQIIRVADSLGEVYFEDFVAQSLKPEEILRFFFQSNQRLQKFLAYLQLDWSELLPNSDFQRSQLLSMLRELMEWAALMKLASQPPVKLLIRDGLLRSVLLTDVVFQRLRQKFEALTAKHGHLLVGVAKRSRVLSYLSVALGLNESFSNGEPSYLPVPPGFGPPLLTQREVAHLLHMSERGVREAERRAFQKLRNHPLLKQVWQQYLSGELDEHEQFLTQDEVEALFNLARTPEEQHLIEKVLALIQS